MPQIEFTSRIRGGEKFRNTEKKQIETLYGLQILITPKTRSTKRSVFQTQMNWSRLRGFYWQIHLKKRFEIDCYKRVPRGTISKWPQSAILLETGFYFIPPLTNIWVTMAEWSCPYTSTRWLHMIWSNCQSRLKFTENVSQNMRYVCLTVNKTHRTFSLVWANFHMMTFSKLAPELKPAVSS